MPDTRTSPLPWHWVDYDDRHELVAADGSVVLTTGPNVLVYDQRAIEDWSGREVRRRRMAGDGPAE